MSDDTPTSDTVPTITTGDGVRIYVTQSTLDNPRRVGIWLGTNSARMHAELTEPEVHALMVLLRHAIGATDAPERVGS